ncbi:ubiquinone biosynthesis protein UbiA [Halobacteriales archaeon QS_4_69_31]|nr:MAG: ubiquinone biosynthesis protein UbiA [Halobacteriales archaeon QS_4_69_31]
MPLATDGRGPVAALGALASQVHPVFMLPPLAASVFGGLLATQGGSATFDPGVAAVHVASAFFALYTAHVKDGYVDFYGRDEDDHHPLTARGCRVALAGASAAFFACLAAVWALVGPVGALLTLPGWLIGFNHAPRLDMHPVSATAGYPTGIAFALLGGHYVQVRGLSATVLALAGVFLVVLSGIKVIDDTQDYDYDRTIGKRTAAVVVGPRAAYRAAYALMATGMVAVVGMAVGVDGVPPSAVAAPLAFAAVAALSRRAGPELATMLLIRGSYLFLAVLVGTVWFRPLG